MTRPGATPQRIASAARSSRHGRYLLDLPAFDGVPLI
jgi:hypothetical protein